MDSITHFVPDLLCNFEQIIYLQHLTFHTNFHWAWNQDHLQKKWLVSEWVCFLIYIWLGKCLLTLSSEVSLLVPGSNEELFFLAASMAAKRNFTILPLKWWSKAFTWVLGRSGTQENPKSLYLYPLPKVLFLTLCSRLHKYAEETSFLQKNLLSPPYTMRGSWWRELRSGYNIGKYFEPVR